MHAYQVPADGPVRCNLIVYPVAGAESHPDTEVAGRSANAAATSSCVPPETVWVFVKVSDVPSHPLLSHPCPSPSSANHASQVLMCAVTSAGAFSPSKLVVSVDDEHEAGPSSIKADIEATTTEPRG